MNNRVIQEITLQLQRSLDSNYDVVNMQSVMFVIQQLENTTITKEQLETTRLAKYINELRRRTKSDQLARRAKNLLKKWRDIFMPTLHQQSSSARNPGEMQRAQTATVANAHKQKYTTTVANSLATNTTCTNKISTGSANNNTSSKHSSSLSNGGFSKQQQSLLHQVESLTTEARMDTLRPRGSRTVSPIVSSMAGTSTTLGDRKQQPTSFANVLNTTQLLETGASSSAPANISLINHCNSDSSLPHINQPTVNPRHRQSPVSLIDFDSNHSRPQMNLSRTRALVNGDKNAVMRKCSGVVDLNDSSSITIDLAGGAAHPALENQQSNQGPEAKLPATPPMSLVAADVCSSSSNHRKSKKHKKEKKRSKQGEDTVPATSIVPSLTTKQKPQNVNQGTASFLTQYIGGMQSIGDEELNNVKGDVAAFPPHDSLSSSSMSRFPSNISTNTMSMQNCGRVLSASAVDNESLLTRADSDLTFAGKFKNSSNNAGLGIINDSVAQLALKKSYSDSKDSSDVVVVESRSCSPFTTAPMGPDDSCSSSSRVTIAAETLNLIADSNPEIPIDNKSSLPQRLPLTAIVQQDQGLSSNSSLVIGAVSQVSASTQLQPLENVKPAPKKRGRKKGSRGYDAVIAQTHAFLNASMFERPRLLLGNKKVKTTKELLADIQSRRLGSSATSSPTLVTSRQSLSPSTCSEASFQSDLTNTRASLPNLRFSPDVGSSMNCRQSDIDDANSNTDSNEAASLARSKKSEKPSVANMLPQSVSSVDEYLGRVMRQLPPVDCSKVQQHDIAEITCSCTVREVQKTSMAEPKEQVVIIKSDDEGGSQMKSPPFLKFCNVWPKMEAPDSKAIVANGPKLGTADSIAPSFRKSPKRPIKSIFDLDYDEENDPLHSFVEAAKAKEESNSGHDSINVVTISDTKTMTGLEKSNMLIGGSMAFCAFQNKAEEPTSSLSIPRSGPLESSVAAERTLPTLPTYEVVEDVNCLAKYRYEVQTNCVTEHHINLLHNCYVPNVNGCWSAPVPMLPEHRKRLRKYSRVQAQRCNLPEQSMSVTNRSWWLQDEAFLNSLETDSHSDAEDQLYERVVPQYDHIIMDSVVKDLSQVKFTTNYMKKKLKRLKVESTTKVEAVGTTSSLEPNANEINCQRGASDSKKTKKRKRTRTASNNEADINSDANDDPDKKHKHQRRRKHRKIRDSSLKTSTQLGCKLSRSNIKDAITRPAGEEADQGDIRISAVHELFPAEDSKPKVTGDASDENSLQLPVVLLQRPLESSDVPTYSTIESTKLAGDRSPLKDIVSGQEDDNSGQNCDMVHKTDDHSVQQEADGAALFESSSNSSNSCSRNNNDINSDKTEANNQLGATILGEGEDSHSRGYSFCSGDLHKDTEASELNEDVEADEDYPGFDEDDDYGGGHNDDEEHEVVTHDMTSSTSTTSQQHIVLTIKKKILKPAPSLARADGNENGMFLPFRLSTDFNQDDDQLSIVTSSSTPTTIKIRRKIKPKRPPLEPLRKCDDKNQSDVYPFATTDSIVSCDNNNVKNGPVMAPNESLKLLEPCDEGMLGASENNDSDEVDREPQTLNGVEIRRGENFHNDSEGLQPSSSDKNGSVGPLHEVVADDKPAVLQLSAGVGENGSARASPVNDDAPKCDDHDLYDQDSAVEGEEPKLLKDNNGLLASFNELTDDNFIGLRVVPNIQHARVAKPSNSAESAPADQNHVYLVQEFKEWHEVMQVPSYNDELLTILPYVVID